MMLQHRLLAGSRRQVQAVAVRPCLLVADITQRNSFHTSTCVSRDKYDHEILPFNRVAAPSADAMAAIVEARRKVFGIVPVDNVRSGRKILRAKLKGPGIQAWYPDTMEDLGIYKQGILEEEFREELFREEQLNNRLGKTRIKGKVRGPTQSFARHMRLEDVEEELVDEYDWFNAEDALPDEAELEKLAAGMDDEEQLVFSELLAEYVAEVDARNRGPTEKAKDESKADKAVRARTKTSLRKSLDDKRSVSDFDPKADTLAKAEQESGAKGDDDASAAGGRVSSLSSEKVEFIEKVMAELREKLGVSQAEIAAAEAEAQGDDGAEEAAEDKKTA